jgi:hypothetical protein
MNFIKHFFDRRKVWKLLPDYPIYTPPHKSGWEKKDWITPAQAQENYAFFLEQKAKRVETLAQFLAEFGAQATLDDDGLVAVSEWMFRYGAYLRDTRRYRKHSIPAFENYEFVWDGPLAGLNVMHDVYVFCGECIVEYHKDADWFLFTGKWTKRNHDTMGFNKAWIGGMTHWAEAEKLYPPQYIEELVQDRWVTICDGARSRPSRWNHPLSLARRIRYHASNDPEPPHPEWPNGFDQFPVWFDDNPQSAATEAAFAKLDSVSRLQKSAH